MSSTIRFDILRGSCAKCEGPVYFTQVIDWEGNRVNAVQCWNGHYESLEIDHFLPVAPGELTREQVEEILPFVDFVRLDGSADQG
ncbi:MAG: hypothetical protein HY804_04500 [Nitrospinae bacterium]|nr:hypothetical protein [Nitrospinota bacterium]